MAYDVFISHSSKDKLIADAVVASLEQHRIRCFITPRDIPPGQSWPATISRALTNAPVMVLIFSKNSNNSGEVEKEIALALDTGSVVIHFRIDESFPKREILMKLAHSHWLDAINPLTEKHIEDLLAMVSRVLPERIEEKDDEINSVGEEISEDDTVPPKPNKKRAWIAILVSAIVFVLAVLTIIGILVLPDKIQYENATSLYETGNYCEAGEVFDQMLEYKDSNALAIECRYQIALILMNNKQYEESIDAFEALDGYKDSALMIEECN